MPATTCRWIDPGRNLARRPAPRRLDADREQPEAENVGHHATVIRRQAEIAEQLDRHGAEREPPGESSQAIEPEPRSLVRHRQDAEARAIGAARRRKQETSGDQRRAQAQKGYEVGKNDLPQNRRPRERKKRADAPDCEGKNLARAQRQPQGDRAQPLQHGGKRQRLDPAPRAGCCAAEQPLGPEAQRHKSGEEQNDVHNAVFADLFRQDPANPPQLSRHCRQRRRNRRSVLADRCNAPGQDRRCRRAAR